MIDGINSFLLNEWQFCTSVPTMNKFGLVMSSYISINQGKWRIKNSYNTTHCKGFEKTLKAFLIKEANSKIQTS